MESAVYRRKRRILFFAVTLLGLALFDFFVCASFYRNYQKEMKLAAVLVQDEEPSHFDTVAALLKGEEIAVEEGFEKLEEYRYLSDGFNSYRNLFVSQCMQTAVFSLVLYAALAAVFVLLERQNAKRSREQFREIETALGSIIKTEKSETSFSEEYDELGDIYRRLEEVEQYLRFAEEQAKQEREETKVLVTNISHQLKTPAAALETCLELLRSEELTEEERQEFLNRCWQELKGLKELLTSLLGISKMEAGMITLSKEKLPVFDTILEAVNRVYPKASEKNIELVLEESKEAQIAVMQDRKWLAEALINILDNCIKYSPAGSTVSIHVGKNAFFLCVEICDEGIGIPKEELHKIWQRFYRGESAKVREQNGSGVGLYLTREIVAMHKGTVSVYPNRAGEKGSRFMIQIPL